MITSNLRNLMEEKQMPVRELMEKTGLAKGTINRARGDLIGRCTLDTLATIATALGVKVKDLFSED
jgi:DNA-binding Xre family transcriptional regulator